MSAAPVLLVVGTASSVGKSVLVTALCRIFAQDGVRVAPFKAQNMSNNADVTPDGLEIGRAQSEQAAAAGLAPSADMNPVLLKPQADRVSQLVLDGRPAGVLGSSEFVERRRDLWPHVERARARLRARFDLVVAEGAGSPAEPNLRAADIVNMRLARHAGATTLLVGDIDRGGVFAHLLGTLDAPDLGGDSRFASPNGRAENHVALVEALGSAIAKKAAQEWLDRWQRAGLVASPIQNLKELSEDPQAWENDYLMKTHCSEVDREVEIRGLPVTLSKTPGSVETLGPELGQDTEILLMEVLEMEWDRIEELKAEGVIP